MPPSTLENQQGGTAFSQATFLTTDFIFFNSGCLPHANCPSACIFYVLIWLPHPQLSPSFCFFWMLAAPNGCAGCRIWWGNFWQFRHCFPSLGSILIGQGFVQNGFSARERSHWAQAPRFLPLFRNSPAVTRGLHIPCPSSAKPWFPHLADLSRKCFINQLTVNVGFLVAPESRPHLRVVPTQSPFPSLCFAIVSVWNSISFQKSWFWWQDMDLRTL